MDLIKTYNRITTNNTDELLEFYDSNSLRLQQLKLISSSNLGKIIEIRSNVVTSLYNRGRFSEAIKEAMLSIEFIDSSIENNEKWLLINFLNLGYSFYGQNKYSESIKYFEKVLCLDQFSHYELDKLIEIKSYIVTSLYSDGRFSEAIKEAKLNLGLIKLNDLTTRFVLVNLKNLGYSLYKQGEFMESIKYLNQALDIAPKDESIIQTLKNAKESQSNKYNNFFYIIGVIIYLLPVIYDEDLMWNKEVIIKAIAVIIIVFPWLQKKYKQVKGFN